MINTGPEHEINAEHRMIDDQHFLLIAKEFIKKDDEITISYGEKDNYL
jgi:hypothetical protein